MKRLLYCLFLIGLLHNSMVLPAESTAWQRRKQAALTLWHCGGLTPEKHMCSKEEIISARRKIAAMSAIALGALLTTTGIWYKQGALRRAWNRAKKSTTTSENVPLVSISVQEEEIVLSPSDQDYLNTASESELIRELVSNNKSIASEENELSAAEIDQNEKKQKELEKSLKYKRLIKKFIEKRLQELRMPDMTEF